MGSGRKCHQTVRFCSWWGADQRFYKTTLDLPDATRTIIVEYDLSINLQAPIP